MIQYTITFYFTYDLHGISCNFIKLFLLRIVFTTYKSKTSEYIERMIYATSAKYVVSYIYCNRHNINHRHQRSRWSTRHVQ